MAKTNWKDPQTSEIRSPDISGLQDAVGKIEESIGINSAHEVDIPLSEVFISSDDRHRIFQAPKGKRNWLLSPTVVVKRNGAKITSGFELDHGGGAIILDVNDAVANTYTVDATHTINSSDAGHIKDTEKNKVFRYHLEQRADGIYLVYKEVV